MKKEIPQLLLVEEDALLAELTSFRLELLGYGVRCVATGEEAIEALQKEIPDLVILDPVLPGMDGIELINRIQNDERTHGMPILAFSTDADLEAVQRCFQAGATDYLVTPYDPAVLERKLHKLLQNAAHLKVK